mmetsp:Transcript_23723/g.52722  ORF Transcript_23723/g.52722 Transcript_23723/m.52722 type:complete len:161 (+) Transcript_23723:3-485(+)
MGVGRMGQGQAQRGASTSTSTSTVPKAAPLAPSASLKIMQAQIEAAQTQASETGQKRQVAGTMEGFFQRSAPPARKKSRPIKTPVACVSPSGTETDKTGGESGEKETGDDGEERDDDQPTPPQDVRVLVRAAFQQAKVRFKFNQGYSNAVKRSVSVAEFL